MEWFRWWHGTLTDPKFQWVARKSGQSFTSVIALWVALLERASSVTQGDASVTRGDVAGFDCDDHDVLFGLEDGSCARILDAFTAKGMLADGVITNWEKRQPKREDPSAERTRAYRERKSKQSSVTTGDAPVTQSDDKKRVEKSKEEKDKTISSSGDDSFDRFWEIWPKTDRKADKAKCKAKWAKANFSLEAEAILAHVGSMKATNQQWKNGYEPAPLTYLNGRRWEDGGGAKGESGWWSAAGFEKEWQALNAGCTERTAYLWRAGKRIEEKS